MAFWKRPHKGTGSKSDEQLRQEHLRLWTTIKGNLVIQMIGADEIRRLDYSVIESAMEASIRAYASGTRPLQTVHFGTNAYDSDPRALFDIPEMRAWSQALYKKIPFLFSILDAPTIDWFFPAVADIEVVNRQSGSVSFTYRPGAIDKMNAEILSAENVFFRKLAQSTAEFDQLVAEARARIRATGRGVSR